MYWKDTGLLMSKNLSHGFTLLEILLAVTIFTMMSLTIYHAAIVVAKGSATVTNRVKKTNEIQQVINMLEFDISHATIYPRVFLNNNKICCSKKSFRLIPCQLPTLTTPKIKTSVTQ